MSRPDDDLQPLAPEDGADRYIRHRDPELRQSSIENARTRLSAFLDWCEDREIEDLNDLDGRKLADFVTWRREQIAAITLQKQLSTIRMALRFWENIEAVENGLAEKLHAPELPDGAHSRDDHLEPERAERILSALSEFQPGSRRHVIMALLWRTGMRRGALRSIDVRDLRPDDHALMLRHRPDGEAAGSSGGITISKDEKDDWVKTKLKNGEDGERMVYLGPRWFQIIERFLNNPDRFDVTDEIGREPLLTTRFGRPTGDTIYTAVNRATQPCEYGECPHDRDPNDCEARGSDGYPSKCPSSHGPHAVRRGSITHHLAHGVTPEVVSERMDVSLSVLYEHYDARTEREKMTVRKTSIDDSL